MTLHTITPITARQLAITRQHLAGSLPKPNTEQILNVVCDLGCLQLDPTTAVARSHPGTSYLHRRYRHCLHRSRAKGMEKIHGL